LQVGERGAGVDAKDGLRKAGHDKDAGEDLVLGVHLCVIFSQLLQSGIRNQE
jgi:hypothetical protein